MMCLPDAEDRAEQVVGGSSFSHNIPDISMLGDMPEGEGMMNAEQLQKGVDAMAQLLRGTTGSDVIEANLLESYGPEAHVKLSG